MPLWKNYCFHQKFHYSPDLPHHSKVSKRCVVSFLTLVHTESSTFGAIDKREAALTCQMVIFTEQIKTFPVLPLLKQMLSALRVTLARAGWELQGGEAGQWWSWLLVDAAEVSGDRMPSHHHTLLQQQRPDKAMVQHDQQSGHFVLCRCGQTLLGVKRSSLHFRLSYLKLCSVLDAYQIFTAVWVVSHFSGDALK